jgi:F-type H+-transporting ATPase subunit b
MLILLVTLASVVTLPASQAWSADPHAAGGVETHEKPSLLPDPTDRTVQLQALWVVIIFLALVAILYPTAWKNVLAGLKKREERIRKDIADAEASRAKAEATLKEYNTKLATAEQSVRDMISKAAGEGERIAAGIRTRAQQEAEEIKERATKDIDAARKQAVAEIYEKAAELATTVASKIIHKELKPEDQRELVNRSLDQLQTVGSGKR